MSVGNVSDILMNQNDEAYSNFIQVTFKKDIIVTIHVTFIQVLTLYIYI